MKKQLLYLTVLLLTTIGCEEILIEEDISDATVRIIAPTDQALIENTAITFSWNRVDQATEYRLQVAQPTFENANQILQDTTVTTTSFSTTLVKNMYEWRVRAQNANSETLYTKASFSTIENEDFSARQLVTSSPADNSIFTTTTHTLRWEPVTEAILYRIQLIDSNDQIIQEETVTTTNIQLTFPEGVTKWQVRAENNTQSTLYTSNTLTLDTKNPKKPILTAPANETALVDTNISFTWTRETVAGTTEIDSIYIYTDELLTQLVNKDQVTSPTSNTLDVNSTYYWLIKAFDKAGNQSEASDTFTFSIN